MGAGGPGGCEVIAGGGGAAGPAQSIRHQAPLAGARTRRGSSSVIMYINIHYNTANIPASRSVSRNVGVTTARSMQRIAGSRPVCTFFNTYKRDCQRMYWYVLVSTSMYCHDIFIIRFMLVQTCLYRYIPVCLSIYYYVISLSSMYWYILVRTGTNRYRRP